MKDKSYSELLNKIRISCSAEAGLEELSEARVPLYLNWQIIVATFCGVLGE